MKANKNILVIALSALLLPQANAQVTFQGIGFLAGGTHTSRAYGISDNGSLIVGFSSSSIGNQACRWTLGGGLIGLGILAGGTTSQARRVSGDGLTIVGESGSNAGTQAFRWTSGGGMIAMGDLPGGTVNSSGVAASSNGSVIVGLGHNASNFEAFRWTPASGMVGLGLLGGATIGESHAYGVSSDGSVICGYSTDKLGHLQAYRWTAATGMVGLKDLAGGTSDSRAYGMSSDGSYIVGRSDSGSFQAFRWFNNSMLGLGILPTYLESRGRDVSDDGKVVVGRCDNGTALTAFIWTDTGGMKDLKTYLVSHGATGLTGWTLEEGYSMTPDGSKLVGYGLDPSGVEEGWVATLPYRLSSNSISVPSVIGGASTTGTVMIPFAATTNLTVSLTSSNSSIATVPQNVVIPAGQLSANYTVTTSGVSSNQTVSITATYDSTPRSASLIVKPAALKSIAVAPSPATGGNVVTGKVTLTGIAPPAGTVVSLSSTNAAIVPVPTSVTVLAGQTTASFTSTTAGVNNDISVTLSATSAGVTKTAIVLVKAATIASVKLTPASIASGKATSITLTLSGKAGPSGVAVSLATSDNTLLSVPASITVPAGLSTVSVKATGAAVTVISTVNVTATLGVIAKTATLTIVPAALNRITLKSAVAVGGSKVGGTVSLTGFAAGDVTITLTSSNSTAASVPASVKVLAGKASASFTVTTKIVTSNKTVTITATSGGITKTVTLTVTP